MDKVIKRLQNDDHLVDRIAPGPSKDKRINVENLEAWAGDHIFDDFSDWFGIEEKEGRRIRAYFQEGLINRNYDFLPEMYREFPDKLEGERKEYLEEINEYREEKELETFSMDEEGRVHSN